VSEEYGSQGLSGREIKADLLAQFKKRLDGDCNLRDNDSYRAGYSANIEYHVKCYGLDEVAVEGEIEIGTKRDELPDTTVDDELVIEQEDDLSEVRERLERSEQEQDEDIEVEVPTMERAADGTPVRTKRKYTKRVNLVAAGGAEDFKE